MKKTPSIKDMALKIIEKEIERWRAQLEGQRTDKQFDLSNLRIRLSAFIEKVSNIPMADVAAASAADASIKIDDVEYSPSAINIVKQYHATAAANPLIEAHDRNKSHRIHFDRMFTPSLFKILDYEDERQNYLILGEGERVLVGNATPSQFALHDKIKDVNFEAQDEARKQELKWRNKRKALWKRHLDCKTTDDLMKKLGAWKGR